MTARIVFFALLLCLVSSPALFSLGENLTVKIAVMGPGDELYFWWGHIALIIEDSVTGRSRFYDYGIFSFKNDKFFYNFAFGRLLYSCGSSSAENSIAVYISTNRDVVIYTMDLPPEKRITVRDFAEINILPENKDYYYHHFKDNCSTRIRDIIDFATDGQFKSQYGQVPGRFTLRQHVRRHTWFSPAADWILNFLMGQDIDKPITVWEDMFLPSEVGRRIEEFSYSDSNGVIRKLVTEVEFVNKAEDRPAVLDVPRKQWPRELAFSLVLSAIFGFFFFLQAKNRGAGRVFAGLSMSLAGFVFGVTGLILYFMGIFTNHDYTYHNANMIFSTPLLLAAVPLGVRYALIKDDGRRFAYGVILRLIWLLSTLGVFVSMFIKLLPQYWQQNLTDQMLMLPIALVFALQPIGLGGLLKKLSKRGGKT
jgi:hypothetical protein